jgi:SAM-dependent methyltransferase
VDDIKEQWAQRQRELGNTARAVLFKNLPAGFNERLHRAHVRFLLDNLPAGAQSLLDVGCGYGRTAAALKQKFPNLDVSGVELCEEFARAFEANIGPCFIGGVADFETDKDYDAITIVTLLMYLDPQQQRLVLAKLWQHVRPGGRMILIEPYLNLLTSLRRKFRVQTLAPTGGEVAYFRRADFLKLLSEVVPGAAQAKVAHFNMPFAGFPTLHLGAVLEKPLR